MTHCLYHPSMSRLRSPSQPPLSPTRTWLFLLLPARHVTGSCRHELKRGERLKTSVSRRQTAQLGRQYIADWRNRDCEPSSTCWRAMSADWPAADRTTCQTTPPTPFSARITDVASKRSSLVKNIAVFIRPAAVQVACRLFFRSKRLLVFDLPSQIFNSDLFPTSRRRHQCRSV